MSDAFEKETLGRIGAPAEIGMRHRIPHFQHIIGGYASGYYSYMWSEVMDADAFGAFEEKGDIFDPATAKKLYDNIYSAGGKRDPADAYKAFRGRLPTTQALLEKRGLAAQARTLRCNGDDCLAGARTAACDTALKIHSHSVRAAAMAEQNPPGKLLERVLVASRWLLAPFFSAWRWPSSSC